MNIPDGKREFHWAVLSVKHEGCPFAGLSTAFNTTVRPTFFDASNTLKPDLSEIDVYLNIDTYVDRTSFFETAKPLIPNLKVFLLDPSIDDNRTFMVARVKDSTLSQTFAELNRFPNIYARGEQEYLTIKAFMDYVEWRPLLEKMESKLAQVGEVKIERLGKIRSIEEYKILYTESQLVETPVSSLSKEENAVLMTAITYGYYEQPRRMNLDELAKKMGIPKATLNQKLRKIEERLVLRATQKDVFSWRGS